MILVGISGPPASGKTTLWTDLADRFAEQLEFLPDAPRKLLVDGRLAAASRGDRAFQEMVGESQIASEDRAGGRIGRVCDKSLVDAVAYWDVLVKGTPPTWAAGLTPIRYAISFVCDYRDIETTDDPLQQVHFEHRVELAARIEALATSASARVVHLSGPPDRRSAEAHRQIERLLAAATNIDRSAATPM